MGAIAGWISSDELVMDLTKQAADEVTAASVGRRGIAGE